MKVAKIIKIEIIMTQPDRERVHFICPICENKGYVSRDLNCPSSSGFCMGGEFEIKRLDSIDGNYEDIWK